MCETETHIYSLILILKKCAILPQGTFSKRPSVFITAAHHHAGLKRDAASIWLEDITRSSLKICLRELQNYAGSHEDIYVVSIPDPFYGLSLDVLNSPKRMFS